MGRILDRYERGDYEKKQKEKFILRVKEHAMTARAKAKQQRKESHAKAIYTIAGIALFMVVSQALGPIRNYQVLEDFAITISVAAERLASETCPTVEKQVATSGKPIWVAGYPGSGSEMFRSLIEASTGLDAENIYDGGCHSDLTVTCKTHWPLYAKSPPYSVARERFYDNALLLIRNPAKAIPSYFSDLWEGKNDVQSHTTQAPEDEWKEWRDQHFDLQIEKWKSILIRWTNRTSYALSFYIPFEEMINEEKGPKLLKRVLREFEDASFFVPVDDRDDIQCIWRSVVKYSPSHLRSAHSYTPSFRPEHKDAMLKVLDDLLTQLSFRHDLVPILSMYRAKVESDLRIDLEPKRFEVTPPNPIEDEYNSDEQPQDAEAMMGEPHSIPTEREEMGDATGNGQEAGDLVQPDNAADTETYEQANSENEPETPEMDFDSRFDEQPDAGDVAAPIEALSNTITDAAQSVDSHGDDQLDHEGNIGNGEESSGSETIENADILDANNESDAGTPPIQNGQDIENQPSPEEIPASTFLVGDMAEEIQRTSTEEANIESREVESEVEAVTQTVANGESGVVESEVESVAQTNPDANDESRVVQSEVESVAQPTSETHVSDHGEAGDPTMPAIAEVQGVESIEFQPPETVEELSARRLTN